MGGQISLKAQPRRGVCSPSGHFAPIYSVRLFLPHLRAGSSRLYIFTNISQNRRLSASASIIFAPLTATKFRRPGLNWPAKVDQFPAATNTFRVPIRFHLPFLRKRRVPGFLDPCGPQVTTSFALDHLASPTSRSSFESAARYSGLNKTIFGRLPISRTSSLTGP